MQMIRKALIILPLLTISATALAQERPEEKPKSEYSAQEVVQRFDKIVYEKLGENTYLSYHANRMLEAMISHGAKELVETKQTSELPVAEKNLNLFLDKLLARAPHTAEGIRITTADVARLLESRNWQSSGANPFSGLCPLFPFCK